MSPGRLLAVLGVAMACTLTGCDADEDAVVGTTTTGSQPQGGGGSGAALPTGGGGSGASTEGGSGLGPQGGGGSAGAGGETPFEPEPIPIIDEEPPALCADPSPSGNFQFLDDICEDKVFPSFQDRDFMCPTTDPSATIELTGGGTAIYVPSSQAPVVDSTALAAIVPSGMNVTAILIRRVGGVPHYRYLSNGTHDVALQPWSTTKVLAAANAASRMRSASSNEVGLTASVGSRPLGDLVTSMCNYDYDPYSSNSLGAYFHDIGGRQRAYDLIHDLWLHRPSEESFGGNYGEAAPSLGYTFAESGGETLTLTPDSATGFSNHLSTYTLAEAIKRLVLHREEAAQRLPGIQWPDLATLFYGADGSIKYGPWGGMSADKTVYLQSGHDLEYIERRSKGRWRIFSKSGLGSSGQFLVIGYGCFPVLDDELEPVPGWGRELVVAAQLAVGGASWAERDRLLARAVRQLTIRVFDGRL